MKKKDVPFVHRWRKSEFRSFIDEEEEGRSIRPEMKKYVLFVHRWRRRVFHSFTDEEVCSIRSWLKQASKQASIQQHQQEETSVLYWIWFFYHSWSASSNPHLLSCTSPPKLLQLHTVAIENSSPKEKRKSLPFSSHTKVLYFWVFLFFSHTHRFCLWVLLFFLSERERERVRECVCACICFCACGCMFWGRRGKDERKRGGCISGGFHGLFSCCCHGACCSWESIGSSCGAGGARQDFNRWWVCATGLGEAVRLASLRVLGLLLPLHISPSLHLCLLSVLVAIVDGRKKMVDGCHLQLP